MIVFYGEGGHAERAEMADTEARHPIVVECPLAQRHARRAGAG